MKVVVTGAAGFLGGNIARKFRDVGWEVTAFDVVAAESVTIRELAEKIVQRFPTELTFGEPRPGDVPPAAVSAKRAEDAMGWRSEMPFDRGLTELIDGLVAAD